MLGSGILYWLRKDFLKYFRKSKFLTPSAVSPAKVFHETLMKP
jgi:hypothetical protein